MALCAATQPLLDVMDIPLGKKDCTRAFNTKWLIAHLHTKNSGHDNYRDAMSLLYKIGKAQNVVTPKEYEEKSRFFPSLPCTGAI